MTESDAPTQFTNPSPKALNTKKATWLTKYQELFNSCPVDKSFRIELADVSIATLRSVVSKKFNNEKHFTVIDHKNCYEICRRK